MKTINLEQTPQQEANRQFADKLSPESRRAYRKVNEPEEDALIEHAKAEEGETLLTNTLTLIQQQLRIRFGSDRIYNEFLKDKMAITEIKAKLLQNLQENGNDRREEVVQDVVARLVSQQPGRASAR